MYLIWFWIVGFVGTATNGNPLGLIGYPVGVISLAFASFYTWLEFGALVGIAAIVVALWWNFKNC